MNSDGFLAVGSHAPDSLKAELYGFGTGKWTPVDDYPYGSGFVCNYDMVYMTEISSYLVIGGSNTNSRYTKIAMFASGKWFDAGNLKTTRRVVFLLFFTCFKIYIFKGHRAQWFDNALVVAGGELPVLSTESCMLNQATNKFTCVDIIPELTFYRYGVAFAVPFGFCVWSKALHEQDDLE